MLRVAFKLYIARRVPTDFNAIARVIRVNETIVDSVFGKRENQLAVNQVYTYETQKVLFTFITFLAVGA